VKGSSPTTVALNWTSHYRRRNEGATRIAAPPWPPDPLATDPLAPGGAAPASLSAAASPSAPASLSAPASPAAPGLPATAPSHAPFVTATENPWTDEPMAPDGQPETTPGGAALSWPRPESRGRSGDHWIRRISFRSRITVLVAAAVGVAVALAALASYIAVSRQLEGQANNQLQSAINYLEDHGAGGLPGLAQHTGDKVQVFGVNGPVESIEYVQDPTGSGFYALTQSSVFNLTPSAKRVLTSASHDIYEQTLTGKDGKTYLVATVPILAGQLAVQIGYPTTNMDNTLAYLRLILILVALCGVGLAATLGWAVGKAGMRPVEDLTLAAEHVAQTQDLTANIDDVGNDELGRLAASFNSMLTALASSRQQQAQLVSDAGHELRTPLTSLRTNIEVLMRAKDLPAADRDELLADVHAQLQELGNLVGDLVDLARDDERQVAPPEPVAFDQIVRRAVDRAQRRAMSVHFDVSMEPAEVVAQPALLERAVMNVLDNAAKWSPRDGHVNVDVRTDGALRMTVTDQGPGIAPEDLPHIFDRFYRAQSARSMPGSGLGLAIVKRVISSHGGRIDVGPGPQGGTRVEIVLPLDRDVTAGTL